MINLEERCDFTPRTSLMKVLGGVGLAGVVFAAGATVQAGATPTTPMFNGTYTAVQKSGAQPDDVKLWVVSSNCLMAGCTARAVMSGRGLDFVFDGKQWNQVAVPQTGTCRGAPVPARAATVVLVPKTDGSLSGAMTSTVLCDGVSVDTSLPLTLTPS